MHFKTHAYIDTQIHEYTCTDFFEAPHSTSGENFAATKITDHLIALSPEQRIFEALRAIPVCRHVCEHYLSGMELDACSLKKFRAL